MKFVRAALVVAIGLGAAAAPGLAQQGSGPDGEALYREYCRSCHGVDGVPPQRARDQYSNIPVLSDSAFMASRTDDSLLTLLRLGAGSGRQRGRDMESFSELMNESQMRAVIAYVRTLASRRRDP